MELETIWSFGESLGVTWEMELGLDNNIGVAKWKRMPII